MAKNWTLWRKDDNDDDSAEQHETGRKYQSLWDVPDDRDLEDDSVFGGFGYTEKVYDDYGRSAEYRYEDTIDDADTQWYRRSSFRYGRHADYSPSQLFRSTFTSRYYSSGDNEAQNKAIRALRVLTRNANTITDKSTNGTYAVQYSRGADSNGATDNFNDDKQRVVYVSPDELLATTTTEEEDNVVDALTGFVLLRVQMAQMVESNVIAALNATNNRGLGLHVSQLLFNTGRRLENIDDTELNKIAGNTADLYFAGVITKSMLMRLARRGVVANWGGFAPYFIRHAKKFSAMRAALTEAEVSLESLVGQIAYNMLDDETPIELPEFAVEIMNKRLGSAVEPEKLLQTCQEVVAELRAHMATAELPVAGAGGVEEGVKEFLQKMKEMRTAGSAGKSAIEEHLEPIAGAFFDATAERAQRYEDIQKLQNEDRDEKVQLAENKSVEQLVRRLEKHIEKMRAELEKTPGHIDSGTVNSTINDMLYDISSRPKARNGLHRVGQAGALQDLREMLTDSHKASHGEYDPEDIKTLKAAVEKFKETALKAIAATSESAETKLADKLKRAEKLVQNIKERFEKLMASIRDAYNHTAAKDAAPSDIKEAACNALNSAMTNSAEAEKPVADALTKIADMLSRLPRTRSAGGIEKIVTELTSVLHALQQNTSLGGTMNDYFAWHASNAIGTMARSMADVTYEENRADRIQKAIQDTLHRKQLQSNEIIALAANELFKPDPAHENGLADYQPEEIEKLQAEHKGYEHTITSIYRELLNSKSNDTAEKTTASEIGDDWREKMDGHHTTMAPVDDELFGKKVKANTKILDGTAIGRANDEARNDPEEDYIAYIHGGSGDSTKPIVRNDKETPASRDEFGRTVRGGGAGVVKRICQQYRNFIERIRDALQFQAGKRTEEQFGLRSGDLDEGGLHKLNYDCEHIWSKKTTSRLPDVAVGILVDQSGSMGGTKIDQARTICIILAEALRKVAGVRLYVYGHTANTRSGTDLTIYEHYTPTMGPNLSQLGNIRAHTNNYDGYAIKEVAKRLMADPAKKKYLFVIADGLPAGSGYGGADAQKHVKSVCKFIRNRLKIGLYAFAVGIHGYEQKNFKDQYDENHIVFVNNVMKCLPQIVRFLRNTLQKEKKLVTEAID